MSKMICLEAYLIENLMVISKKASKRLREISWLITEGTKWKNFSAVSRFAKIQHQNVYRISTMSIYIKILLIN